MRILIHIFGILKIIITLLFFFNLIILCILMSIHIIWWPETGISLIQQTEFMSLRR